MLLTSIAGLYFDDTVLHQILAVEAYPASIACFRLSIWTSELWLTEFAGPEGFLEQQYACISVSRITGRDIVLLRACRREEPSVLAQRTRAARR